MDLELYFIELPAEAAIQALDRKLANLSPKIERLSEGQRLWVTHVPETSTRPFLIPKPFDILPRPLRLTNNALEEYRVGMGAAPQWHWTCRSHEDSEASCDVLLSIAIEIMSLCGALLCIDDPLGMKLFGPDALDDHFNTNVFAHYPGKAYEVAHETPDGDLCMTWFVNARWIRAWRKRHQIPETKNQTPESARFASLDYS